ncbi:glycosyltransferase family 4 protein [Dyadobacter psychrotolerans]|uniref:Glycosyltransferase WbuB n=1 Tax=Dyadobacter psychrotolerans TaxID=2541721 RepID=A0A4R5DFG0_9BACT|nr:glycosyltransferase family 4 protein [Dyadobacter psychrotolerans]TDE12499.1 glycosyltransferase WbuB [Dyadobacter psychrotolerans]
MRILLIHQYFLEDNAGGGSRWNEMSRIWTEAGHELTVLAGTVHYMSSQKSMGKTKNFSKTKNKDGVTVIRCPVYANYNKNFTGRLLAYFSFAFSSSRAGLFYTKSKYDLIIVSSPPLFVGIAGLVLSFFKAVPFVFEVRDLWPESAIETGVLKNKILIKLAFWFEKLVYRKARLISVLTPAFKDKLIAKAVPEEKIIYIPNAADFETVENVLRTFDEKAFKIKHHFENKFVLTYVGAHGIANALVQILITAELLREENVCFLLIGGGMKKDDLMLEAVNRKSDNVRFVDEVSKKDAIRYILASDMGISILKKTEVFKTVYSNKTFDYFSCRKPVLMAIDGISRKLVEDADAGVYIEPENPEDFAKKVRHYLNNPDLIKRHGENGYAFAKINFNREILAQQYLNYIVGL